MVDAVNLAITVVVLGVACIGGTAVVVYIVYRTRQHEQILHEEDYLHYHLNTSKEILVNHAIDRQGNTDEKTEEGQPMLKDVVIDTEPAAPSTNLSNSSIRFSSRSASAASSTRTFTSYDTSSTGYPESSLPGSSRQSTPSRVSIHAINTPITTASEVEDKRKSTGRQSMYKELFGQVWNGWSEDRS
ncbi:hypothetical protein BZG36_04310 [Bifiguratus adelaidae]|uniref:Uncharacterized protein n=1 Tax=Bifiguratus adelaidae TaxID=1938954 RepID=A0A261XZP4_9FUNG|nr:hypothetical protein BZG36_04310 [Bifiguratus adelaidae]